MALIITTWCWGTKFGPEYVERLERGVARNLSLPHTFKVIQPPPEDAALTQMQGCFARLRLFDPAFQAAQGIEPRDTIINLDLDLIVTGNLDALARKAEDTTFGILTGINASNPCPYNGSVWSLRGVSHAEVWESFTPEAARRVPFDSFPDDQAWFAAKLPHATPYGPADGVYGFCKPGWPRGTQLPRNACIVAFPGWRDPVGFQHLDWVQQHWVK